MSRSDIPNVEDRRPFYLYVDEFQNFATDSFAVILSEARKYGLNLTVANQYISQMTDTVRDAVFGNVGTMMSMRVSPEDAPVLAQQFAPQFEAQDILQMNNRHFVCTMMINGEKMPAFSGTTLRLPTAGQNYLDEIIANTRANYARKRTDIEQDIAGAIEVPLQLQSKTAREKAKKAAKENASRPDSNTITSPSGVAGPQKLGDLMAQIKAAAEAGDPNSMKIEGTRNNKPAPADNQTTQTTSTDVAASVGNTAVNDQSLPPLPPLPEMDITSAVSNNQSSSTTTVQPAQLLKPQPAPVIQSAEPEGLKVEHNNDQPTQSSQSNQTSSRRRRRPRNRSNKQSQPNNAQIANEGEIRLH